MIAFGENRDSALDTAEEVSKIIKFQVEGLI
jgi:hypothetical protein